MLAVRFLLYGVIFMRQFFMLALAALLISLSGSTFAAPAPQGADLTTTLSTRSNLRAGPGVEWRIMGTYDAGTPIRLDGQAFLGGWVRGIVPDGTVGWAIISAVSISQDEAAGLREIWVEEPFTLPAPAGAGPAPAAPPSASEAPAGPAQQPPPPVASAPLARGFAYGGHVAGLSANTVAAMRQSGMTWMKKQWRHFPGQNAGQVAGIIQEAQANGFNLLLGIVGPAGSVNDPNYRQEYANFVGGVAGLGVNAIEVWNEPNIDREWAAGTIDPASYTNLLALSYNAIKAANPNTMVISGAPAPTGFFGGCSGVGCDDDQFIRGMAAAGAARYMDCLGIHYNEGILPPDAVSGDPRGNSGHYTRYLRTMIRTYQNAIGGARPLCFTELGYLSPEGFPPLPGGFAWAENVTVAQQAAWLRRAVDISASSGVRLVIVWNVDFTNYGEDPMAGYAMIRPGGACPACEALGRR